MASGSQSQTALKTFELTNDVKELTPEEDLIYRFDAAEDRAIKNASPWSKDPHYFKKCRISAVALIKMVTHARSGGIYEIMGLMQGKVVGDALVIMDAFALPVQGTETRVNAANEANEFMVQFLDGGSKIGRPELAIGWYHSHPGYGCWLSGIDVSTQSTNQKYQDPFVAVVIDPNRTISAGKVDIGAFRTYPEGYTPPNASSNYQSIPLSKIEDFGVHADHYYPLEVSVFKSSLDKELLGLLWNKYWVNTLSQSPLISNRAYAVSQLTDLAAKVQKAQSSISSTRSATLASSLGNASGGSGGFKAKDAAQSQSQSESQDAKGGDNEKEKEKDKPASAPTTKKEGKKNAAKEETAMEKAVKDSTRIAAEAQHGLIAQVLKDIIFSMRPRTDNTAAATVSAVTDTVMT